MSRFPATVLLLLLASRALPAQDVTLAVVLERLHQYLNDYANPLPVTVAAERYVAEFRPHHQQPGARPGAARLGEQIRS